MFFSALCQCDKPQHTVKSRFHGQYGTVAQKLRRWNEFDYPHLQQHVEKLREPLVKNKELKINTCITTNEIESIVISFLKFL